MVKIKEVEEKELYDIWNWFLNKIFILDYSYLRKL